MGGAQKALEKPREELVICREKDEGWANGKSRVYDCILDTS